MPGYGNVPFVQASSLLSVRRRDLSARWPATDTNGILAVGWGHPICLAALSREILSGEKTALGFLIEKL